MSSRRRRRAWGSLIKRIKKLNGLLITNCLLFSGDLNSDLRGYVLNITKSTFSKIIQDKLFACRDDVHLKELPAEAPEASAIKTVRKLETEWPHLFRLLVSQEGAIVHSLSRYAISWTPVSQYQDRMIEPTGRATVTSQNLFSGTCENTAFICRDFQLPNDKGWYKRATSSWGTVRTGQPRVQEVGLPLAPLRSPAVI